MLPQRTGRSDPLDCSVLVLSCDSYRDLWAPFFRLFQRYWPDCSMPIYLGTECATVDSDWVQTLRAGEGKSWSARLRYFLNRMESTYVLLLLEDFFLDRAVSNSTIDDQLRLLTNLKGTVMRLFPNPPHDYLRTGIGVLHPRAWYRVSLQAAIWNRAELSNLLAGDETPWDFEVNGSHRSRASSSHFYCAVQPVIHYRHVVERGEWFRSAARFYRSQNIGCDFAARPTIGLLSTAKKVVLNRVRRMANWLHSRWICLREPELAAHG